MVIEVIRVYCGEKMSSTGDVEDGDEFGTAEINHRGRLTIPKDLRDEMHLEAGTEFAVVRDGREIRLVRELPDLVTLTAGKSGDDWEDDAFRDAGEATFGGR